MKLRNKKTGEIIETGDAFLHMQGRYLYKSLAELYEEWEDAPEEPKRYWFINSSGGVDFIALEDDTAEGIDGSKQIGNYFDTREEAEKAVEKLEAIQRLKSHYIKFKLDFVKNKIDFTYRIDGTLHSSVDEQRIIFDDMNLLFGGEE